MSKLPDVLAMLPEMRETGFASCVPGSELAVRVEKLCAALEEARELLEECLAYVCAHAGGYQANHHLREIHPNHADTLTKLLHALGRSEDEIKRALGR